MGLTSWTGNSLRVPDVGIAKNYLNGQELETLVVSERGYFIYCNGKRDLSSSGNHLAFDVSIIPYVGNDSWIEPLLHDIRACLISDRIPDPLEGCKLCQYRTAVDKVLARSK
jgi:deoxyinosine 3'endonuclease (endonuclease V)